MRIVSLVPAGTDIVMALGLGDALVGISHACSVEDGVERPRVTRCVVDTESLSSAAIDAAVTTLATSGSPLYTIDAAQLAALQPDLIVTQGVCDVCAVPALTVSAAW